MQITVNSQALATELRAMNRIVPAKPAIAILSHVLLTANASTANGDLNFWATDLEVGLSSSCQATVMQPGKVALPLARFLSLVEQFQDGDVSIAVEDAKVAVTCGAFRSKLAALPAGDFPLAPPVDGQSNILDGDAFRQLIARTRYAINATSQKYVMQGALLTLAGPAAAMVATDGKRLALATAARTGTDASMVIPAKALDVLASSAGDVEVTVGPRHLHFSYGGQSLSSRMIDGKFPTYERIIPRDNDKVVTVSRHDLSAALKRIVLVSEDNRATYLLIESGTLTLASRSAEVGQADEAVRAEYDGPSLKVCVNGSFVLDFLEAASGATIALHLKDANSAMLMMDGEDHIAVLMLMKG
jgi:DNA polymerase-3 subunit beta